MALATIIDDVPAPEQKNVSAKMALTAWVMGKVNPAVNYRDSNYKARWDEYYRLWRGIWKESDKSRDTERSKIITPALAQAIESAVAELEEATFGTGKWFDVDDNFGD